MDGLACCADDARDLGGERSAGDATWRRGVARAVPSRTMPQPCASPTTVSAAGRGMGAALGAAGDVDRNAVAAVPRGAARARRRAARAAMQPDAQAGAPGQAAMRRRGSSASTTKPSSLGCGREARRVAPAATPISISARPGAGRIDRTPMRDGAAGELGERVGLGMAERRARCPSASEPSRSGCRPIISRRRPRSRRRQRAMRMPTQRVDAAARSNRRARCRPSAAISRSRRARRRPRVPARSRRATPDAPPSARASVRAATRLPSLVCSGRGEPSLAAPAAPAAIATRCRRPTARSRMSAASASRCSAAAAVDHDRDLRRQRKLRLRERLPQFGGARLRHR